jgi:GTP-binding protein
VPSPTPLARLPVIFVGSFPDPCARLTPALPEIALVGRSNVGKSSLLNALLGRRVARVSRTPGRTGHLNVYRLPTLYLLDLPGYGWARASQSERARLARLVRGVLTRRPTLSGVLWLLDVRHDPSRDDLALAELLGERGLPVLAALTKADKLTQSERRRRTAALAARLALPPDQIQLTSSTTGLGISDLAESLLAFAEALARR